MMEADVQSPTIEILLLWDCLFARIGCRTLLYIYICLLWCFILLGKICGLTCMALVMITLDIARWIQAKTFTACWCFCRCYEANFSRHKQWIKITMNLTAAWSPSYRTFPRGWEEGVMCDFVCEVGSGLCMESHILHPTQSTVQKKYVLRTSYIMSQHSISIASTCALWHII